VNNFSFEEGEGKKESFGANVGAGYGTAWSDVGNVYGAEIYHVGINVRHDQWALGWMPFFGVAKVSHEGTHGWGSTLWGAYHFGGGNAWRFSAQGSFTYSSKTAEEQGCQNGVYAIFLVDCTGQPVSTTRSQVIIRDGGVVLTAERKIGARSSLLFMPGAHYTYISASNELDTDPANNTMYRTSFWSPGIQLGFATRFGDRSPTMLVLLAGAEYAKSFRPDRAVREWVPSLDARLQF
jgi:hypothetical protein